MRVRSFGMAAMACCSPLVTDSAEAEPRLRSDVLDWLVPFCDAEIVVLYYEEYLGGEFGWEAADGAVRLRGCFGFDCCGQLARVGCGVDCVVHVGCRGC